MTTSDRKTIILLFRFIQPHHYPIGALVFSAISVISGYAISVSTDKVHYLFPYISSTGTTAPASCYFGIFLNLSSVCAFLSIYYRHSYLEKCIHECENLPDNSEGSVTFKNKMHAINDVSFFLGALSAFGLTIVANFQSAHIQSIHFVGAGLVFIVGGIYCWMQVYLTHIGKHMKTNYSCWCYKLFTIRLILAAGITMNLVLVIIGVVVSAQQIGHTNIVMHWTPDMKVKILI